MTKKSIYIYILVSFINAQFVFAQSNSDNFSQSAYTPGELIVRLHPDASSKQLDTLSQRLGAVSVSPIFSPTTPAGQHPRLRRNYLIRFPAAWALEPLRRRYARHPAIEAVEMNRLNRPCAETLPNDPNYREQWNLAVMNMPQAWGIEQGNPEVTVAVVDGGIDMQHPEFRSQLWRNVGEIPRNGIDDDGNGYVDDINGWDFSDAPTLQGNGDWTVRDNEPEDERGHGTYVSGIIGAAANNGIGIAGIAWRCRLMPLRVEFKYGVGGYIQNDDVAAAIVYAADNGARVINMSWGDTVNAFIIEDAIAYAYARGCVMVAAAGNEGAVGSWYPAGLKTVISVAGVERDRQLYTDSNFGATIDIAAPGAEILSTDLNGGYQKNLSGTSMAAAHVSGVAALVLSANPDYTNAAVRETLISTAEPLFISRLIGAGLVNAYTALTASTELIAQIDTSRMFPRDAASNAIEKIEIFGSAGGIGFIEYWLDYGIGEVPDLWFSLGTLKTKPKFNVCLHKWDTAALAEGKYTVRLSVKSEDGEIKRDRTVVEVNHTPPRILRRASQAWFSGNSVASVVLWETDKISISEIEIFQANGNLVRTVRSDSENLLHIVNLSDLGIPPGAYMYRLFAKNRAAGLRINDNNDGLSEIEVQDAPIYPLHLLKGISAERPLHAVDKPVDINRNGRLELITAEIGTNSAHIFEIQGGSFNQVFAFPEPFLPRAIADTDNDGLIEIFCSAPDVAFLLEQPAQGEFPTERIWEAPRNWGITIADTDTDGTPEIFTRDDSTNAISVVEADADNTYRNIATLENPTSGSNGISANIATGDFDGDSRLEILIADSDGDVFIYETTGNNQYRQTWTTKLPEGRAELFAAGDMDGDGKAEFAVCGKTGTEVGPIALDIRYNHWLLTLFKSDGDDTYRPVWTQRIRDVRDGGNGMTIADANNDGRNELCIAVAPNFYLVQYDGTDYRPIWHHPATNTFKPIVVDFNGDSENALLFNSDNALTVFATATTPNLQSENQQSTPISVVAPRRPRLRDATYSPPNQLSLVFDKPMGISATHAGRYRLHKFGSPDSELEIYTPRSAMLDKTQQRVLLTFPPEVFQTGNRYQIEALQLSGTDGANLADDASTLTITLPAPKLAETIVYPNPAACDQVTFDKLPIGTNIHIYDVSGNRIATFAKTEREQDKKVWNLSGISSGIYIYVLSSDTDRRIGKLSIIR